MKMYKPTKSKIAGLFTQNMPVPAFGCILQQFNNITVMVDMKKTDKTSLCQRQKLLDSKQVHLHVDDPTIQWHLPFKMMRSSEKSHPRNSISLDKVSLSFVPKTFMRLNSPSQHRSPRELALYIFFGSRKISVNSYQRHAMDEA